MHRLLVVIHNQVQTGPYRKVLEMCEALALTGIQVTLLCTSNCSRIRMKIWVESCVEIVAAPDLLFGGLRQGLDVWNVFRRCIFMLRRRFSVIHAIDSRPVVILPSMLLKYLRGIPLVLSWWDLFGDGGTATERSGALYASTVGRLEVFFETYFRKYADYSTVVTPLLKRKLIEYGFPENKIEIIKVGANVPDYRQISKRDARMELGIPENDRVLCYLGSIFRRDMELLMVALSLLNEKIEMPRIVFIGNHIIAEDVCKNYNLFVTGYLASDEDVRKYLLASDYGLIPFNVSRANLARWPSKISDYFAMGLPIISTSISDLKELFSYASLGILSESDSPVDYMNAMYTAIYSSEKQFTHSVMEFAVTELGWNRIALRLKKIYDTLC